MKKYFLFIPLIVVTLAGFSCQKSTAENTNVAAPTKETTEITYYISPNSNEDSRQYCNGVDMDSAGYKATLTKKVTVTVDGKLTDEQRINKTLNLAAQAAGFSPNLAEAEDYVILAADGTVTFKPLPDGGWAGVSIFFCSWTPFVEKNLEQFEMIKEIK